MIRTVKYKETKIDSDIQREREKEGGRGREGEGERERKEGGREGEISNNDSGFPR